MRRLTSIGTVIARRELKLAGRQKVVVEIGKPRKFRGSPDYYCPYRIRGLGDDYISYSAHVDSVAALDSVLLMIGATLYTCEEAKAGLLSWGYGQARGDLGLPVGEMLADLLPKEVREVYTRKDWKFPPRPPGHKDPVPRKRA